MIVTLPNTSSQEVDAKLLELREQGGVVALGRVLTLIILTSGDPEPAIAAANDASREHPCRVIVVTPSADSDPGGRLDAQVRVGADAGASEVIILTPRGPAGTDVDTLVTPLLLPDAPIVMWWPLKPPEVLAEGLLGELSQRRISDALATDDPVSCLQTLATNYTPGDTDLSWARTTLWRGLIAATHETITGPTLCGAVHGNAAHPAVLLLAGWLAQGLEVPVKVRHHEQARAITGVCLRQAQGTIQLQRPEGSSTLTISIPGQNDQHTALPMRSLAECLVEDLRRLDPDDTYAAALTATLDLEIT